MAWRVRPTAERNRHRCAFKPVGPSGAINCWPTRAIHCCNVQRQCVRSAIFSQCDFLHQWIFWRRFGLLSKLLDLVSFILQHALSHRIRLKLFLYCCRYLGPPNIYWMTPLHFNKAYKTQKNVHTIFRKKISTLSGEGVTPHSSQRLRRLAVDAWGISICPQSPPPP